MFTEPSDIVRDELLDALRTHWSIEADSIEHAAVGFGSHHYVVDDSWFLTLDDLDDHPRFEDAFDGLAAAFATARALREAGLGFVLSPCSDDAGAVVRRVCGHYSLAVVPFVRGRSSSHGEHTTDGERREVLEALGRLHATPPPPSARRDPLEILRRAQLDRALDDLDVAWEEGPFGEPTRELVMDAAPSLRGRLDAFDRLAATVPRDGWVVTHGEPHAANVLRADDGRFLLIDWDTVAIGPRERDLWMVEPRDDADLAAYGGGSIDPHVIRLYREWWDLTEIALYVTDFRRHHADDADTRTALRELEQYLSADASTP